MTEQVSCLVVSSLLDTRLLCAKGMFMPKMQHYYPSKLNTTHQMATSRTWHRCPTLSLARKQYTQRPSQSTITISCFRCMWLDFQWLMLDPKRYCSTLRRWLDQTIVLKWLPAGKWAMLSMLHSVWYATAPFRSSLFVSLHIPQGNNLHQPWTTTTCVYSISFFISAFSLSDKQIASEPLPYCPSCLECFSIG